MKMFVMINKALFLVLLAVFILNLLMPFDGDAGEWVMKIGLVVLGVHVLELLVIYKKLQAAGHVTAKNIFWILVAGILHWKPLLK